MSYVENRMPEVKSCLVSNCAYNGNKRCHARGITIGDTINPDCDTFFGSENHINNTQVLAGVGACKVSGCKFNDDYECSASSVKIGYNKQQKIRCLTYEKS